MKQKKSVNQSLENVLLQCSADIPAISVPIGPIRLPSSPENVAQVPAGNPDTNSLLREESETTNDLPPDSSSMSHRDTQTGPPVPPAPPETSLDTLTDEKEPPTVPPSTKKMRKKKKKKKKKKKQKKKKKKCSYLWIRLLLPSRAIGFRPEAPSNITTCFETSLSYLGI
jgi:outer membrane biosynthesis protein TonB